MDSHPDGNARVLCAFRSAQVRRQVGSWLRRKGYEAIEVDSAQGMQDALAQAPPDLVLLDSRLGAEGREGIDLVQAVRRAMGTAPPALLVTPDTPSPKLATAAEKIGAGVQSIQTLNSKTLRRRIDEMLVGEARRLGEGELISLCQRLRASDPFVALGVDRDALPGEVRRAYRQLCSRVGAAAQKKQSSELRPVMEAASTELGAAYAKLSDPDALEEWRCGVAREREQPIADAGPLEHKREAARIAQEGDEQIEQQDWLAALDSYQRAAELHPEAGQYRASLGWAMYLSHGTDGLREAIDHAKQGMKLSPEHVHPPLVLGRLYQFTDRLDLAEKALKHAIRLQPDCADAVRELRILKSRNHGKGEGLVSRILRKR